MTYSNLYLRRDKSSITVLALVALFSCLGFAAVFLKSGSSALKASSSNLQRHNVVNITSSQAGVFWQTDEKTQSWVIFGGKAADLNLIALDERDLETKKQAYSYHYALLKNLEEDKTYYYKIVAENKLYGDLNQKAFSFKTAKGRQIRSSLIPAYGVVQQVNGTASTDAFVIFNFKDKQPLLTQVKSKGEFMLPLNYLVETKTNAATAADGSEEVTVEILSNNQKTTVKAFLSQTNPFNQTLILGKNYDFASENNVLGNSTTLFVPSADMNSKNKPTIIFPKENAVIPAQKPLIKGSALPNQEIFITIHSPTEFSFRTTANNLGEWKIVPSVPLSPGAHTITMTTADSQGKKTTIRRNFIIAKNGEQVLGEATDEGGLITPTLTPLPTYPSVTAVTPTPPKTGTDTKTYLILSSSLIILGLGIMLVF